MIGDYLEIYTYEYLLSKALARISDSYDKRQGAIMWDSVAPHDYQLAEFYMELRNVYKNTFVDSATGEYLDLRVKEQGMSRYPATYALKRADFKDEEGEPLSVAIGTRFSTVSSTQPINYVVESVYVDSESGTIAGAYQLRCETAGTIGNDYTGDLINITFISGIAEAVMSTLLEPAQDEETDEELRIRYYLRLKQKPFGGNITQYDEEVGAIEGVGEVQIYPVWNGGGTVKLSVVDAEYNKVSDEFIETLEQLIDPENAQGEKGTGLGMAPIGHKVTIVTPTELTINIGAKVTLSSGYSLGQVQTPIQEALEDYLLQLRQEWGLSDDLNNYSLAIYIARVTMAILSVGGVANVTNVTINNSGEDLILLENATTQQLPVLGTVSITE